MKSIYTLIAILMLYSANLNAQWDTITTFNQVIVDMKSFDGKLFIGGNFTKNENNNCYWSAYYDGNSITRHTNPIGGLGVRALDVFVNELYAVGSMQHDFSIGVSKWDGSTWVNGGSTNYSHSTIYADDNDLYVVSDNGIIRKKTTGGSFQNFYDFNGNGAVSNIIRFNNELVFAGTFDSINGIAAKNIAQWDGVSWKPLANGISSGTYCMAVFNNELYVAGNINTAGGVNVNNIAKWDGSNWSDVGDGMTGTSWNGIRDMLVFNGALYVVGDFNEMGSVTTHDVAKWDGIQWSAMSLDHNDAFVNSIEVYNNKIYVGTFDFDKSHVFVYTGVTSNISETVPVHINNFKIFPNPVIDNMYIELELNNVDNFDIEVIDLLGNIVFSKNYETSRSTNIAVNCKHLKSGSYFVLIRESNSKSILMHKMIIVN